ncbi:hypothetical protein AYC66_12000 [Elizabethkingia anophelis]|uniref:Uncharacterized protein n=1 Tax=Elizabethkingia anophelis TaxID=1117645 RepID=A0A494J926_9FLAO|nr:hypothetical protein AYC66_12000 [Elizabethkingia anophelis]OPB52078.1 hypothetical protein BAY09_12950 [Elizabethkingia anophelis]
MVKIYFLYQGLVIKLNYQKKNIAVDVKAVIPGRIVKIVQNSANALHAVLLPCFLIFKTSVLKKQYTITSHLSLILNTLFLKDFFLSGLRLK